jgi:trigger factor
MNIIKEKTGELEAILRVEVKEEDYLEKVNKVLKDYQRKANMPGFRPGKVPFGLVKKMYGTAVLADEVNKMVSEELTSYLRKNEIRMLGYPIPDNEKTGEVDWQSQHDFDLFFKIGFAPSFDLKFSEETEVDYYQIKVDDEQLDEEVKRLAEQHGTTADAEVSEEEDWIDGDIVQLDEEGNEPEVGINAESYIYPKSIENEDHKKLFIGLKEGDSIDFDLREVFPSNKDIARLLKIIETEAGNIHGKFRFSVKKISRMVPAIMDEEFYKKVFPDKEELDEKQFRETIRELMEKNYLTESDKKFFQDAVEKLMEMHQINLPEEFLKSWMLESNKEEITAAEIEKDFPNLAKSLQWDLLKQKIAEEYDIKVSDEDIRNYIRNYFEGRFGQEMQADDQRWQEIVNNVLSKQEDADRIEADIFNSRLLSVLKDKLSLKTKDTSLDEFIAMVKQYQESHDHDHNHDHEHDHEHDHDHQG